MSDNDNYEEQVELREQEAYNAAMIEAGREADRVQSEHDAYVAELEARIAELNARIAELEAENEKINYFFRKLRMFCIFAHWDNPNTEAEFYKVDAEIREYLSEYKVCIDQLTAHDATERKDDKECEE